MFNPAGNVKKFAVANQQFANTMGAQNLDNLQPYASGFDRGFQSYQGALGLLGPQDQRAAFATFRETPGYQFSLDEGQRALEGGAAARGGLYSGAAMRALQDRAQGVADQGYNTYLGRLGAFAGQAPATAMAENDVRRWMTDQYTGQNTAIGDAQANQKLGYLNMGAQLVGSGLQALSGGFGAPGGGGMSRLFAAG